MPRLRGSNTQSRFIEHEPGYSIFRGAWNQKWSRRPTQETSPQGRDSPKNFRGTMEALGNPEESGQITKHALWSRVVTTITKSAFPN